MRRLGQHFLKSRLATQKIVAALELENGDMVIEIGPGHGELTEYLVHGSWFMDYQSKIIAIEKDKELATGLRKKLADDKNIEVIEGDALRLLPSLSKSYQLKANSWKLVGNIPYYITGRLLRIISELEKKPKLSVFTIQKEVAERITAAPPHMNRLAAIVQFWAIPNIVARISKKDFQPEPEVDSAVIRLETKNLGHGTEIEASVYYKTIRALFAQPRKTILNNLIAAKKIKREILIGYLEKIGIPPENRPQNLSMKQIMLIAEILN